MVGQDWLQADDLVALVGDRRFDRQRVGRWFKSARHRGLLESKVDPDQLGQVQGGRYYRLTPAGAQQLNQLAKRSEP